MEIRVIGRENQEDIRLKNESFPLYGRLIPRLEKGVWSWTEALYPREEISRMCFPEENYDYDAMASNHVFLGAYLDGQCVGLAILAEDWFKYMYLEDLKVSSAYRRRGVGAALVREALRVAQTRNYNGIYAICQDNNLDACRFYLGTGFAIGGFDNRIYRGTNQADKANIFFYLDSEEIEN